MTGFGQENADSIAYVAAGPAMRRRAIIGPILVSDRACRATHHTGGQEAKAIAHLKLPMNQFCETGCTAARTVKG